MRAIPALYIFVRSFLVTARTGITGCQSSLTARLLLKLEHIRLKYISLTKIHQVLFAKGFWAFSAFITWAISSMEFEPFRPPSFTYSSGAQ